MKTAGLSVLVGSVLLCAQTALAAAPAPGPAAAAPIGSPADWLDPLDYPKIALRFDMTGVTAFRLTVDDTGKPSHCDIAESSGFDVLDNATCQRLMANARFSPSRDASGKPVAGAYSGRVRWVMPPGNKPQVSEHFSSMLLSIDQAGNTTSCRFVAHVPDLPFTPPQNPCTQASSLPPAELAREFRSSFQGLSADVEVRVANVFTPALRARVLAPVAGHEQRALNIHHFTVTRDAQLDQCNYEQQRGSDKLAVDFCATAQRNTYDPPFSAFKDGTASGWHIMRVLLKTGQ